MAVSLTELDELEAFFASVELPETIMLNAATKQNAVKESVQAGIALIRSGEMAPRLEEAKMNILRSIKTALLAQQQQ
ncbi:DUF6965 family protein [Filimonas effusa]|uniref:DUF6965 domain-containing protein n=1 Tax=Filimonas effusa TaxID=2508721 RepID=A0A4Q1D5I6_9BACT|nr:hypothetical protein [Filimonas effusa]RXK83719.1 hypothetical protein ESB13_16705 [Filimonas effusa]